MKLWIFFFSAPANRSVSSKWRILHETNAFDSPDLEEINFWIIIFRYAHFDLIREQKEMIFHSFSRDGSIAQFVVFPLCVFVRDSRILSSTFDSTSTDNYRFCVCVCLKIWFSALPKWRQFDCIFNFSYFLHFSLSLQFSLVCHCVLCQQCNITDGQLGKITNRFIFFFSLEFLLYFYISLFTRSRFHCTIFIYVYFSRARLTEFAHTKLDKFDRNEANLHRTK